MTRPADHRLSRRARSIVLALGLCAAVGLSMIPTDPQAGFYPPPLPPELSLQLDRVAAGPEWHGYPMQSLALLAAQPAMPMAASAVPPTWAALAAINALLLIGLNLAFVGHLRRAYASPRRGAGRRG